MLIKTNHMAKKVEETFEDNPELTGVIIIDEATHTIIDEVKPIFRIEQSHFPCGAVLESSYGACGQLGKISHEGCRSEEYTGNNNIEGSPP